MSSDSSIEDGQYVVEEVVSHRIVNGKLQFLLKWKGYDENENSWENENDLHCEDLLSNYISSHADQLIADVNKYNKKKKGKKLTDSKIFLLSQQKIEDQIKEMSAANSKSTNSKTNNKAVNHKESNDESQIQLELKSDTKFEPTDLKEGETGTSHQKQESLNLDNDSDVVEIDEISSKSTNDEIINEGIEDVEKQSNKLDLPKEKSENPLNSKQNIKTSNNSSASGPSINSTPEPALNSFNDSEDSDIQLDPEEDFTNKHNFKIVAILNHKKNGNKLMCECLTDNANCLKIVTIPVSQVKKINMNAYLQYLESQIVSPL